MAKGSKSTKMRQKDARRKKIARTARQIEAAREDDHAKQLA